MSDWLQLGGFLAEKAAQGAVGYAIVESCKGAVQQLKDRLKGARAAQIEKADSNATAMLERLSEKVGRLEESDELNKSLVERALAEPSFGILFNKALLHGAEADGPEKRDVLAELIAQRMLVSSESRFAVAARQAVDGVNACTSLQLRVLGFLASLTSIRPGLNSAMVPLVDRVIYVAGCERWTQERFAPYVGLQFKNLDLMHLESAGCLFIQIASHDVIEKYLARFAVGGIQLTAAEFDGFAMAPEIRRLANEANAGRIRLSTQGMLLGTVVSDQLCNADPTNFAAWDSPHME